MNNIGIGIMCFGDEYYFKGTLDKIKNIQNRGVSYYILTDQPELFENSIRYDRQFKSYHDKIILTKHILKKHDICILLDADLHITDYSFLDDLKTYNFKNGISYVETLLTHPSNKERVRDIQMNNSEWIYYYNVAHSMLPNFGELETIWEYFMVFNKNGINESEFYKNYEKLQIAKEYCDLTSSKEVKSPGEGVSIHISSKISQSTIQKDENLGYLLKDKMVSISRKFTPKENWPDWML
jgi:hypothetical protein